MSGHGTDLGPLYLFKAFPPADYRKATKGPDQTIGPGEAKVKTTEAKKTRMVLTSSHPVTVTYNDAVSLTGSKRPSSCELR